MASFRVPFTENSVPVSEFSGCPPSAGGLKRGSRQVPVQVVGSAGSMGWLAWVFITNERAVGGVRSVETVFPACLPKNLVPTEEGQMDACPARCLHIEPLRRRPVLIVTNGEENLVPKYL